VIGVLIAIILAMLVMVLFTGFLLGKASMKRKAVRLIERLPIKEHEARTLTRLLNRIRGL